MGEVEEVEEDEDQEVLLGGEALGGGEGWGGGGKGDVDIRGEIEETKRS